MTNVRPSIRVPNGLPAEVPVDLVAVSTGLGWRLFVLGVAAVVAASAAAWGAWRCVSETQRIASGLRLLHAVPPVPEEPDTSPR